jgi:hypothetical protein
MFVGAHEQVSVVFCPLGGRADNKDVLLGALCFARPADRRNPQFDYAAAAAAILEQESELERAAAAQWAGSSSSSPPRPQLERNGICWCQNMDLRRRVAA